MLRFLACETWPIRALASGEMAKEAPLEEGILPMEEEWERLEEGEEEEEVAREEVEALIREARRRMKRVERIMLVGRVLCWLELKGVKGAKRYAWAKG
jgi:hypothetical protein